MTIETVDCTTLRVKSSLITEYIAEIGSPTFSLNLTYKLNCGTAITVALTVSNIDQVNESYNITTPSTGVYSFKLEKTVIANNAVTTDYSCFFLDCDKINCSIVTDLAEDTNSDLYKYYQALTYVENCETYPCDKACEIYNFLISKLNTPLDCGCQ